MGCHLFVVLYEERTLRTRFGAAYELYRRNAWRWIPHPPRSPATAPIAEMLGTTTHPSVNVGGDA